MVEEQTHGISYSITCHQEKQSIENIVVVKEKEENGVSTEKKEKSKKNKRKKEYISYYVHSDETFL